MKNPRISIENVEGIPRPLVIEMSMTEPVLWLIDGDERVEVRGPEAQGIAVSIAALAAGCALAHASAKRRA